MSLSTTYLFRCLDGFSRMVENRERQRSIPTNRRGRRYGSSQSATMVVLTTVLFHLSRFEDFMNFWIHGVEQKYRGCFRELPSCARFVAPMPRILHPGAQIRVDET